MDTLFMQQTAPAKPWAASQHLQSIPATVAPGQTAGDAEYFSGNGNSYTSSRLTASLPVFPDVRPICLEDKPLFDSILSAFPPQVSELTFTNLFAWRKAYGFVVSSLLGYLLIASSKGDKLDFLDPIGPQSMKKAVIEECFKRSQAGTDVTFMRLPSDTAELFADDTRYAVEEDRDNFDYVYRLQDLTELSGGAYDGKRNLIKRFRKTYSFEYSPMTEADIEESLVFQEAWCTLKDCASTHGLATEREALQEMLLNFQALGIKGGVIRVGGKIVALSLGEQLNPETLVVHIEKADGEMVGIYQALNAMFTSAQAASFTFVNREQDLGIPGLRQAKLSYHPHHMVPKYKLSHA